MAFRFQFAFRFERGSCSPNAEPEPGVQFGQASNLEPECGVRFSSVQVQTHCLNWTSLTLLPWSDLDDIGRSIENASERPKVEDTEMKVCGGYSVLIVVWESFSLWMILNEGRLVCWQRHKLFGVVADHGDKVRMLCDDVGDLEADIIRGFATGSWAKTVMDVR
jgi:hypothetical protein